MTNDHGRLHAHLPRLTAQHYSGQAAVHWVMNVKDCQTGWLGDLFHHRFRELLLHAQASCELACPVYCVMPDHIHLLLMGITERSDQLMALRFLHRYVNLSLNPVKLQKQNYDHVLRTEEREKNAFRKVAYYILENPVRAGLVKRADEYRYSGCLLVGYPDMHVHSTGYWDKFWKIVQAGGRNGSHVLTDAATKAETATGADLIEWPPR